MICIYLHLPGIFVIESEMSVPARDTIGTKAMITSLSSREYTSLRYVIVRSLRKVLWESKVLPRTMTKYLTFAGATGKTA